MADEVIVWGYCDANCKHRVLTLDQTAALIQEMAANGFQVPDGFIPKTAVNSIVEQNSGTQMMLFIGTQAEYDAWTGDKEKTFAIISDDPTLKGILDNISSIKTSISSLEERLERLGFKQGSITLTGGSKIVEGINFGSVSFSNIATNEFKRQGNYVIAKISADVYASSYGSGVTTIDLSNVGTIPKEFIPLNKVSIRTSLGYLYLETDGTISYYVSVSSPLYTIEGTMSAINIGYEAEPLE